VRTSSTWLVVASCAVCCGRIGYDLEHESPSAIEDGSIVVDAGQADEARQEPDADATEAPDDSPADTPTALEAEAEELDAATDADAESDAEAESEEAGGPPSCVARKRWAFGFDSDPTLYDGDHDGVYDWVARNTVFPTTELDAGVWRSASPVALDTRPLDDFDGRVLVDVRMASRTVPPSNRGAVFWINLDENAAAFSALFASLALQVDGSQTLTMFGKSSGSIETELGAFAGLPAGFIDLHLDVDPAARTVAVWISGSLQGQLTFPATDVPNGDRFATLISWSGVSEFDSVDIRRCEP
jgi:hypothetical protein